MEKNIGIKDIVLLPMEKPIVSVYTNDANVSAILGNYDYTKDWQMSNYILLFARKNLREGNWADFYFPMPYNVRSQENCRYLQKQKIHPDTLEALDVDIIEFVCKEIEKKNYVDIMLEPFYLPTTYCYKVERGYHDILIYGFDKKEKVFYCADFLFSQTASYAYSEVKFEDFLKAYENCNPESPENYQGGLIYLYKVLEKERANYVFDLRNIIHSLRAYYESKPLENWEFYHSDDADGVVFGIEVYDAAQKYVEELKMHVEERINIRIFNVLINHKRMMNERILYLQSLYPDLNELWLPLSDGYKRVQNLCDSMIMKIVKSYLEEKNNRADDIYKLLIRARDIEKNALKEFFERYDTNYLNKDIH